jgi:hypothetical protein
VRYFQLILAFSVVLASACKPVQKPPTQDPDPCADGGTDAVEVSGGGKVVCDGLPPIEGSLGDLADAGTDVENDE